VALSRLTRDVVEGFFTLNTRVAFGHGGDHPSYVSSKCSSVCCRSQLFSKWSFIGTRTFSRDASGILRPNEQLDFACDAAGNLKQRTNNSRVQTFTVDAANALTNIARAGTLTGDGNTALPAGSVTVNGQPAFTYGDFTFASSNSFTPADACSRTA
jgi:hypothetical protein